MIGPADLPSTPLAAAAPVPLTPLGEPLVDAATVAAYLSVDTATVYVCENFVCQLPTSDPAMLVKLLTRAPPPPHGG